MKTHLRIAVASAVIRTKVRGWFYNLVDLINRLEREKAAGYSGRLAEKLLRYDIIVIDEPAICRSARPAAIYCST